VQIDAPCSKSWFYPRNNDGCRIISGIEGTSVIPPKYDASLSIAQSFTLSIQLSDQSPVVSNARQMLLIQCAQNVGITLAQIAVKWFPEEVGQLFQANCQMLLQTRTRQSYVGDTGVSRITGSRSGYFV
jgi:hypothetical protein